MNPPKIDEAKTISGGSISSARSAGADLTALAAIVASALLSAAFSLISVGHIARRAEALAASGQTITVTKLVAALRPVDLGLVAVAIASVVLLAWLEWKRRALSALLRDLTPTTAAILLMTFVGWLGHSYLFPGVLLGGDAGSHVARFLEVRQALEAGQFPRWTNYDYLGSPLLIFTGPLTYLVGGLVDLNLKDPVLTAKVLLYGLHLASGLVFYAFLRRLEMHRVSALVATIGFAGSFAHLHLFLYRGVFPQAFTIFFLILLFHAAEGVMRRPRLHAADWLLFALGTAGLIVNHQPHALFAAFYLVLFGGTSILIGRWRWSGLSAMLTAGFAGVAAAAFAVLPILWEGDWVMIEPDNGFFGLRLPTIARISQLLLWHVTRENWGTDYWAYLGLGLVGLAALGLFVGLRGWVDSEARKLVLAVSPCLVFLPFLYNPVVRDIIFILFFMAILAAVGVEFLARLTTMPRLLLAVTTLVFLDVASTSIQPVARTDKQFLVDIGRFLEHTSPNERFMQIDFAGDQGAMPDIGPGAGPISAFALVQRVAGTHNMAATRVHNYAEAATERVAADLAGSGHLSRDDLRLLSGFNVTRIICVKSFSPGCPVSFLPDAKAPALGRYISIPDASPVLFSRQLVELAPPAPLDKPMVWSESFRPENTQVEGIDRFLDEYLVRAAIEPNLKLAAALPVRQLPDGYESSTASGDWHPSLDSYSVEEQSVRLTVRTDQSGYVQIAHPWYPGTQVLDNGRALIPLQGALNLMVIPLTPGEHRIELVPVTTRIESISMLISGATLIVIFAVLGALRLRERRCRNAALLG